MTATAFSIAHLSDPHLTQPSPVSWRQLCNKRCLGLLSWHRRRRHHHLPQVLSALVADLHGRRPDHTVITGDLTQIGLPGEFQQAVDWLRGLGDARSLSVIPGNHDAYVRECWTQTFGLWRDYLASDGVETWSADDFPSLRLRGPVAIVGINSAVPGRWLRAVGRVGPAQRGRLVELLQQLERTGPFRLVLVHHAPVPGVDPWRKRLLDARETMGVLSAGRPHMVLHGHDHRTRWSSIDGAGGQIPVVAVPSASYGVGAPEKQARYHIYHLRQSAGGWQAEVEVRGLRDGAFVAIERRGLTIPDYA
jgi:3',5'-cyclic AMP phosphodiesterase CpdA